MRRRQQALPPYSSRSLPNLRLSGGVLTNDVEIEIPQVKGKPRKIRGIATKSREGWYLTVQNKFYKIISREAAAKYEASMNHADANGIYYPDTRIYHVKVSFEGEKRSRDSSVLVMPNLDTKCFYQASKSVKRITSVLRKRARTHPDEVAAILKIMEAAQNAGIRDPQFFLFFGEREPIQFTDLHFGANPNESLAHVIESIDL